MSELRLEVKAGFGQLTCVGNVYGQRQPSAAYYS